MTALYGRSSLLDGGRNEERTIRQVDAHHYDFCDYDYGLRDCSASNDRDRKILRALNSDQNHHLAWTNWWGDGPRSTLFGIKDLADVLSDRVCLSPIEERYAQLFEPSSDPLVAATRDSKYRQLTLCDSKL